MEESWGGSEMGTYIDGYTEEELRTMRRYTDFKLEFVEKPGFVFRYRYALVPRMYNKLGHVVPASPAHSSWSQLTALCEERIGDARTFLRGPTWKFQEDRFVFVKKSDAVMIKLAYTP